MLFLSHHFKGASCLCDFTVDVDLGILAEVVFVRLAYCKVTLFSPLSILDSPEGKQPTLTERKLCSLFWKGEAEYLHTLLGILHRRFLSPLPFIY